MRTTVGAKLGLGFGLALLLLGAIGGVAFWATLELLGTTHQAAESGQNVASLDDLSIAISGGAAAAHSYLLTGERVYVDHLATAKRAFTDELVSLEKELKQHDTERLTQLQALADPVQDLFVHCQETIRLRDEKGLEPATALVKAGQTRELLDRLERRFHELREDELSGAKQESESAGRTARLTLWLIGLCTLLAIAGMGAVAYQLTRRFTGALSVLREATQQVEQGILDIQVGVETGDEFEQLARCFASMVADLKARAGAARRLSHGDVELEVQARGPQDELGTAFDTMISGVRAKVRQFSEIGQGDLSSEARVDGERDQMGLAVQGMVATLRDVAHLAAEVAQGDLSREVAPRGPRDEFGRAVQSMVANLREMARMARELARGDLSHDVTPRSARDELGQAFAEMLAQLRVLVRGIQEVSSQLAASSNQILTASAEHEKITAGQTTAVNETTASVSELGRTQRQMVENTSGISRLLEKTLASVERGNHEVDATAGSLAEIQQKSQTTSERIAQLSAKVQQISKIVTTIREITEQINLLALNAAIEAARAGDQGRGFAVVATEVRRLAERADRSTGEIGELIEAIQTATNTTVLSNEENLRSVAAGVSSVHETVSVFGSIRSDSEGLSDAVEQVVLSIRQQEAAFSQIEIAVQEINSGMGQSLAGTRENVAAAREVATLAASLRDQAARFKTSSS